LTQYQGGDSEAFDKLFAEKHKYLLQYVVQGTCHELDENEAKAIVQQVFFRVFQKKAAYRGQTDGEAWGWIRAIARNAWNDFFRGEKKHKQHQVRFNDEICAGQLTIFDDHPVDNSNWLESFVATLSPRERQILELMQDGNSQTKIAAQLGVCLPRITQIKQSIKKKALKFEKQAL
jgi:RNA polymerase sigma factor (sigma-70 family)